MRGGGDDWQDEGLCSRLGEDNPGLRDAFYADTSAERAPAKAHCGGCPVRLRCLTEALGNQETWGVWGGCDEVDLRRALWLDTNGSERERRRFPRCPACRARTESLFIRATCPVRARGAVSKAVECGACGFSWSARTSVAAIELFWVSRDGMAPVAPLARPARVSVPRGRIPSGSRSRRAKPVAPPASPAAARADVEALAASGAPRTRRA